MKKVLLIAITLRLVLKCLGHLWEDVTPPQETVTWSG